VVRCIKDDDGNQSGYPLKAGDVIKFGRMGFIVRELLYNNNVYENSTFKKDPILKHEKYN
jgi:hypothetical protein